MNGGECERKLSVLKFVVGMELWEIAVKEETILAGGMLTRMFSNEVCHTGDLDFFFRTPEQARNFMRWSLCKHNYIEAETTPGHGYAVVFTKEGKPNLHIVTDPIHPNGAMSIIAGFDFSVCMAAYDFGEGEFVFGNTFLQDAQNREFTIHKILPENPTNHLLRVIKYLNRGYRLLNPGILEKYREEEKIPL